MCEEARAPRGGSGVVEAAFCPGMRDFRQTRLAPLPYLHQRLTKLALTIFKPLCVFGTIPVFRHQLYVSQQSNRHAS